MLVSITVRTVGDEMFLFLLLREEKSTTSQPVLPLDFLLAGVLSTKYHYDEISDDSPRLQAGGFLNDVAVSSHGLSQDSPAGIMVSVHHETAIRALIDAYGKGHLLSVETSRAGLRRIGRVDPHQQSLSFFRFSDEMREKGRPRRISDTFCQLGILEHVAHHQCLDSDEPESLDQQGNLLPNEVLPAASDALMDARYHLAPLLLCGRFARCFGQLALRFSKVCFFLPEEAGIVDVLVCGEIGKGLEPHINADLFRRGGQVVGLHFCTEDRDVPLASGSAFDNGSLGRALERAMHDHLHLPKLGKHELALLLALTGERKAVPVLLEREAIIAKARPKPGIAWLFARFAPAEKGGESQINPLDQILHDLSVDFSQFRADFLASRQLSTLVSKSNGDARHAVRIAPLLQGGIVHVAAEGEPLVERGLLFLRWIQPELIGLVHRNPFLLRRAKPENSSSLAPTRNAPFIPMDQSQGLSGAVFGKNSHV